MSQKMLFIETIDAHYIKPLFASIYLLIVNDRACLIDSGTNASFEQVANALNKHGISFDNVDYVILTHIHLDHAGGASQMMEKFQNAKLIVHPYGARHMIDPSKLILGVKQVYGDKFNKLYGEIKPIDPTRIIESFDAMMIDFHGEELLLLDTPGHANHHNCILHKQSHSCFTGDTFGLCYPSLSAQTQRGLLPTTTPVQFSPEKLIESIDKVMLYQPKLLYPTHFGKYEIHPTSIVQLKEHIINYCLIAERCYQEDKGNIDSLQTQILDYMGLQIEQASPEVREWLEMDAMLNAQGLMIWQQKLHSSNKIFSAGLT